MTQDNEESDCTDSDKSIIERIRGCMGGEKAGADER